MMTESSNYSDTTQLTLSFPQERNRGCDAIFKIVVIGDANVGKTSVLQRFRFGTFSERHGTTLGVDFTLKTLSVDGKTVKLHIWDTAGMERFRTITKSYYRNAHGVIVVYDITKERSFLNLQKWIGDVLQHCGDVMIMIVGTKVDLVNHNPHQREVERSTAENLSKSRSQIIGFYETSARDNIHVDDVFKELTRALLQRHTEERTLAIHSLHNLMVTANSGEHDSVKQVHQLDKQDRRKCFC